MTSYEALYYHKHSYGLSDSGIPMEYGAEIHSEQQLDDFIEEKMLHQPKKISQMCLLILLHPQYLRISQPTIMRKVLFLKISPRILI